MIKRKVSNIYIQTQLILTYVLCATPPHDDAALITCDRTRTMLFGFVKNSPRLSRDSNGFVVCEHSIVTFSHASVRTLGSRAQ
jgi:hypothetical protein